MLRRLFLPGTVSTAAVLCGLLLTWAAAPVHAQVPGTIISGNVPPPGGFGTFVYGGGTFEQLLSASACPRGSASFFHNSADGGFLVWIPGSNVSAVNQAILAAFPGDSIPSGTIVTAGCRPTTVVLDGAITGRGATNGPDGVTITASGVYELSGVLADGMVEVNATGGPVELVLAGVDIKNPSGPAIHFAAASEAVLTLAAGTTNVLADAGASELDATVYATMPVSVRAKAA